MKKGWEIKNLEDVCTFFNDGNWIESKDQSESGFRLVQTGNVGIGEFKNKSGKERYISEETFKKLKCTEIFKDDILISRLPDPVGRSCIIPSLNNRMITAVDCTIVRMNKDILLPDYFIYYSQSSFYFKNIAEKITGTTRDRISRSNLGTIQIPFPKALSEQKHIISILDEYFSAIDQAKANIEKNLNNAKEIFLSQLDYIFSKKGNGWMEKKFDEVCTLQRGFDLPTHLRKAGVFPLVSSNGITDSIDAWKVKAPGVVTGRSGTIGNVHYIENDFWPLNTALYIKDFHGNVARFIFYFLKQFDLKKYSSGAGVPTLNRNNVHSVKIYFPKSLETQQKIVSQLDNLSIETKKLEFLYQQKLTELEDLKKSILQKAFSGELKTIQTAVSI